MKISLLVARNLHNIICSISKCADRARRCGWTVAGWSGLQWAYLLPDYDGNRSSSCFSLTTWRYLLVLGQDGRLKLCPEFVSWGIIRGCPTVGLADKLKCPPFSIFLSCIFMNLLADHTVFFINQKVLWNSVFSFMFLVGTVPVELPCSFWTVTQNQIWNHNCLWEPSFLLFWGLTWFFYFVALCYLN